MLLDQRRCERCPIPRLVVCRSAAGRSREFGVDGVLPSLRTDSASLICFCQRITQLGVAWATSASLKFLAGVRPVPASIPCRMPSLATVTSVGHRQRPHRGNIHEERIYGTPARYHSRTRRSLRQVGLLGPGALRVLVPQVVAPLHRVRCRGPLRPHPGQPPARPAGLARAGGAASSRSGGGFKPMPRRVPATA